MWMSELAARSGCSVPTVKYYLREGLLHPGESVGATRSRYDESHVARLRLIRALTDVAGLSLETIRQVLAGIDDADSWHEAVGAAHTRLSPAAEDGSSEESRARVDALLRRQRWRLSPDHPQRAVIARALDTLASLDHPVSDELLDRYAEAMRPVAAYEVSAVRRQDRERSVESAVIGTVLQEPILLAIRRIAQENASRRRR